MDDEQSMFRMKKSAAWQARDDFKALTLQSPLPLSECWEILQRFFIDSDIVESWTLMLNKLADRGEDFLNDRQRNDFLSDATIQFTKKATYELDPISRLLIMGSGSAPDTINWNMRFPDCLFSNFKISGTFGCIDGLPRTGKTSLASSAIKILGEVFHQKVITNIAFKELPEYVLYVPTLSSMILNMVEKRDEKFTAILDETAVYIYKKKALSVENTDFESLARFIGKWKGNLIVISHSFERDIPSLLQIWTTERYHKVSLDTVDVNLDKQGGLIKLHKRISGVPDAELLYVTEDTTALNFDISVARLLQEVQVDDYRKKPEAIIDWIHAELERKKNPRPNKHEQTKELMEEIQELIDEDGYKVITAIKEVADRSGMAVGTLQQYYYRLREAKKIQGI